MIYFSLKVADPESDHTWKKKADLAFRSVKCSGSVAEHRVRKTRAPYHDFELELGGEKDSEIKDQQKKSEENGKHR